MTGTAYTKQNVNQVTDNCPELGSFFTENHRYGVKKSKYDPSVVSTRCSELR